jgi:hypothetical protein
MRNMSIWNPLATRAGYASAGYAPRRTHVFRDRDSSGLSRTGFPVFMNSVTTCSTRFEERCLSSCRSGIVGRREAGTPFWRQPRRSPGRAEPGAAALFARTASATWARSTRSALTRSLPKTSDRDGLGFDGVGVQYREPQMERHGLSDELFYLGPGQVISRVVVAAGSCGRNTEVTVESGTADPDGCGDGGQSVPLAVVHLAGNSLFLRGHRSWPATIAAPGSSCGETCSCALSDELPLELRQRPEDVEYEATSGRRRVDALGEALETDAGASQVVYGGDQVAKVAPEPVEAPYDEGVTGAEVVQGRIELGAVVEGPGRLVRPYPYTASLFQRIGL